MLCIFISVILKSISFGYSTDSITEKFFFFFFCHSKTLSMAALSHDKSFAISLKLPLRDQGLLRHRICLSFFTSCVHGAMFILVRLGDLLLYTMLWFNYIYTARVLKHLCHRKSSVHIMAMFLK